MESFSLGDCFIASRQNEQFGNGRQAKDDDVRIKLKTEKILLNIIITLWPSVSDRFLHGKMISQF